MDCQGRKESTGSMTTKVDVALVVSSSKRAVTSDERPMQIVEKGIARSSFLVP